MKILLRLFFFINFLWGSAQARNEPSAVGQPQPFLFMENKGQVRDTKGAAVPSVLFTVSEGSFKAQLTAEGIHYYFQKINNPELIEQREAKRKTPPSKAEMPGVIDTTPISYTVQRIDVQLLGANKHAVIVKEDKSEYYENYYLPGCGEKGVTDVHGFGTITYKDIYPGIDWVLYAKQGRLKYDFIVHAGADAGRIKIQYTGAERLSVGPDGSFTAVTALGKIIEEKPYSFIQASKRIVSSAYVLKGNVLGFKIANAAETIVIDPSIDWGTYYHGASNSYQWQNGLYADGVGGVYISGYTSSTANMATTGAYQTLFAGSYDAYMAKFNSAGVRLWATYFGGASYEYWNNVYGDGGQNIFLTGYTYSTTGIATTGAYQTVLGGLYDCYLAKFTSTGTLNWATYYGGGSNDYATATAVDAAGAIYISGYTGSTTGISTTGSYQAAWGGSSDAFLAKFSSAGAMQWATYFGGSGADWGHSVACDNAGGVYITGTTSSIAGVATAGSHQPVFGGGGYDVYLAKFNAAGGILWSTYYGGGNQDGYASGTNYEGKTLACDGSGNVYLCSTTESTNAIATIGVYQASLSGFADAFIVKFNSAGIRAWGTYYGGTATEYVGGLCLDNSGNNIYISGNTTSPSGIATAGTYQAVYNGGTYDAFFSKFNASGQLVWGSYFGGSGYEWGAGVSSENNGYLYVGGTTASTSNIATAGAYQTTWSGLNYNGYLARFADSVYTLHIGGMPTQYCAGDSIHIPFYGALPYAAGNVFTAELSDASGNFSSPTVVGTKTGMGPTDTIHGILPLAAGGNGYKLRVHSSVPDIMGDTISLIINPLVSPTVTIAGSASVCPNGTVSLTATSVNGGTAPTYQWIKNGTIVATGTTYTATGNWAAADSIYCIIHSNALCAINPVDTSNIIHINILAPVAPTITITSPGLAICPGQTVSFTAAVTTQGSAPIYQWKKNGANVGTNSAVYTAGNFANGDIITCQLTSNDLCASPATVASNALTISITLVQPTIAISSSGLTVCPGQLVSFTSVITNGGTAPAYQWQKNGVNAGTNSATYTAGNFANGDVVTCMVTSSNPCAVPGMATSNALAISITTVVPTITIAASDTFFCYGRPATFTVASVTNGGTQPQYQWAKNGTVVGPNAPVYKDSFFVNGDVISCKLISSNPCAVPSQAVSNQLVLNVSAILNPIIVRIGNTLKVNTNVNPSFVSYQWYYNNSPIPGATTQTITITQNGMYQVWITDTSGCKTVSAIAWIQNVGVDNTIGKEQIKIYPNPATGIVTIDAPEKLNATLRNALGQILLDAKQTNTIDLSPFAAGVYMVVLWDKEGRQIQTVKLTKAE